MNKVLELTEKVMRALEDHKTDLAFLECEVVQSSLQQTTKLNVSKQKHRAFKSC